MTCGNLCLPAPVRTLFNPLAFNPLAFNPLVNPLAFNRLAFNRLANASRDTMAWRRAWRAAARSAFSAAEPHGVHRIERERALEPCVGRGLELPRSFQGPVALQFGAIALKTDRLGQV